MTGLGLTFWIALLPALSVCAQPGEGRRGIPSAVAGSISGSIVDSLSGEAIRSASVSVWRMRDSVLQSGVYSSTTGDFLLENLPQGYYYLKISSIGYRRRVVPGLEIRPSEPTLELGNLRLRATDIQTDEVEVLVERNFVEMSIDRTSYNVRDQLVSTGGSATQVLENIPSVEVDIDGNVSLRGNSNVVIMINGRPAPVRGDGIAAYLQSLPADMIDRVEVIPNPSAKYEPDGMAGILNLVLRKDDGHGFSGTLSLGAGVPGKANASGVLNFRRDPIHLLFNYGFRYDERESEGLRFKENRYRETLSYLDQDETEKDFRRSHNLNFGLDYTLDNINTLSLSSRFNLQPGEEYERNLYREWDARQELTDAYTRSSMQNEDKLGMDYILAFRHIPDPSKHEFNAELRFESEREERSDFFREYTGLGKAPHDGTFRELQRNANTERTRELSLQMDYMRPIGQGSKLEVGFKGDYERLNDELYSETFDLASGFFLPDTNINNTFTFDEQIYAVYSIYGGKLNRMSYQAGLRAEQAITTFNLETAQESFDNDYFSLFPSAFLAYALDETRTLKLSYSKRVNRPRTRELNPFQNYDDPLNRRLGNPFLKPEYTHSFELNLTQISGRTSLTVSPYYRYTTDIIRRLLTVDSLGVSTMSFENYTSSDSYGLELIGTWQIRGFLNVFASFNLFRVVNNADNVDSDLSNDAIGWNTRLNATLTVWGGFDIQVSVFYRAPMDIEGGRIEAFSAANLALKQNLFGERASISLNVRDVFDTMKFQLRREDENFLQTSTRKRESQVAILSLTYTFGIQERSRRVRPERDRDGSGDDIDVEY